MEALRQQLQEENKFFQLYIIKGGLFETAKKRNRIEDFWNFCHAVFWPTENFTNEEVNHFKMLIADHFRGCNKINAKFKELIQRATLAKRYLNRRNGRYIAKPSDWLNINFRFGLKATEKWFAELIEQRKTVPQYNEGIALLAKAILNYSRNHNRDEVEAYRKEFIRTKQIDLMYLYSHALMHMEFINQ